MIELIKVLETEYKNNANAIVAQGQKAYMKNHFEFYGIKTDIRRNIQKPFLLKNHLLEKSELNEIVKILWLMPQREYQYFAQELTKKYLNKFDKKDIELFEFMVLNKSWWDTIDFISPTLIGNYFKLFPEQRNLHIKKWLSSDNIWLQRSSILFQLKYKDDLDAEFLSYVINSLLNSKEFFINKAIGWVLREYGKTNPKWVVEFADNTTLSNLSRREALRLIKK